MAVKADDLLKVVEGENDDLQVVVKDDSYYEEYRKMVSLDYLNSVGGVSKYINDTLGEMIKNNGVRGK